MKNRLPNLNLLRQFIVVADHGSISEAARILNISQPAVSKGLRELEQTFGTSLVERHTGGARLTRAGELFLQHARSIELEYDHALQNMRNVISEQDSTINVLAGPIWSTVVLPTILGRFHKLFPRIMLNVKSVGPGDVQDDLRLGRAEIFAGALLDSQVSDPLTVSPVTTSKLVVYASKTHPLAQRSVVSAKDLSVNYVTASLKPAA